VLAIGAEGWLYAGINDWTNVGPVGGRLGPLTIDPQNPAIIYLGADVGLFNSKDGGANWNNAGLNGFAVRALIIDPHQPSILYALTAGRPAVFKSTDGGASWNGSDSGLPGANTLAIDPQNTRTLYALSSTGLFKSTDAGASWSQINGPSTDPHFVIVDIAIDPRTSRSLYVAGGRRESGVFKSVDGGTSWSEADTGLPAAFGARLTIDPTIPATMYATIGGGVYKTTDGAASWHAVNPGLPIGSGGPDTCCSFAVVIDPRDSNTLYVPSGNSALFKSTDAGASWYASGLIPGMQSFAIDPRNSSTIYAATLNGIYRSTDGGDSFTAYSRVRAVPVYSLALDRQRSGTILAGGVSGVFQSTDGGMSWHTDADIGGVVALAIDPQNPSIVYAGTGDDECLLSRIFQSADGGTSWMESWTSPYNCLSAIVTDPRTTGTVYAASGDGGVIKSTDGGSTWNVMSSGLPGTLGTTLGVAALAIDSQTTHTLFAGLVGAELYDYGTGTFAPGIFKSTDGAAHWVAASLGIPASYQYQPLVTALAVDPQTSSTVYAARSLYNAAGGFWKSIDGGAHWRNVFPANVYAVAINPRSPTMIYAGVDSGLARSTDGGGHWTMLPSGPGRVRVLALDPQDPNTVYAGGDGGLFAISLAPVLLSVSGDDTGQGAIQHAGTYQLVSSANPAVAGETLVIYCTGLVDSSGVTPQIAIGGQMADVLWFGDTAGYMGLNQINVRLPSVVTPGTAVPVRMTYTGRESNEVTIAVN
jgi:photosystem II stability/assembly factor-like uncharacterized protein